jgi:hypothetical protein
MTSFAVAAKLDNLRPVIQPIHFCVLRAGFHVLNIAPGKVG